MNREKVLELARKADLYMTSDERIAAVERFAALVAAHVKASDGAVTNEGAKVDVQPVAWIKKDRSSIEVSIMSSEYMVNLGFEPLYTHPPAADVQELVEALRDLCDTLGDCGMREKAHVILAKWEGK